MNETDVLAVALHSMQADMARVQQISMNMANGLTPGYKRGVAVQAPMAFSQALDAAAQARIPGQAVPVMDGGMEFHLDARAGTLKRTGRDLDVALPGSGYFEVRTGHGPAYTRQGSFQLDAQGRLVTAQGHAVMGRDGEILLPTANPAISEGGEITNPAAPEAGTLAVLKIVHFDAAARMERLGDGLLGAPAGSAALPDGPVEVRQGFIENSNVNSAHEMTQLAQAMRHFESMFKVAQMRDDMLGTAIRKLGDTA